MVHTFWVKAPFLEYLTDGSKSLELRADSFQVRCVCKGDSIHFNEVLLKGVIRVKRYPNFENVLRHENHASIAPGISRSEFLFLAEKIFRGRLLRPMIIWELA